VNAQPVDRDRPADTIAGFLAAVAIFAALFSLAYRPVRIDPFAIVVALIAAGMGGRHQRLAAVAVATASVCFILGMVIAILTEKPLF
jgi:hypothetical protein